MDPRSLEGAAVLEAASGRRGRSSPSGGPIGEARLYIDTTLRLDDEQHVDDDPERAAAALLGLINLIVAEASVDDQSRLTLSFDGGRVLVVSGTPAHFTTHDMWWFGTP